MTSNVKVEAADKPVRIVAIDPKSRLKLKDVPNVIVDAHDYKTVTVYGEKAIIITELTK